ncbi:MAG: archease [Candidatus Micrarchaeota archaeon]|nr:archease [Candidatus Micrarchaeota archaeon]
MASLVKPPVPVREKYRFLEHTADALFEAYGVSFEDALRNAAAAMFSTIADTDRLGVKETVKVTESAPTLEELSTRVLADLLTKSQIRGVFLKEFVADAFQMTPFRGYFIRGRAFGSKMSPELGRTDVKAVTYHETKVSKDVRGKWVIRMLLDI